MKNSLRQVKGKYDHGVQIHVHRLPFIVSVTLNLSMFMEVGFFLRDFDAGRKLTFGFKILSHIQGFRTINDDGEHLPRDYLSFVTGGWKKNQCTRRGNGGEKYLFFSPQDSRFVEDRRRLLQDYLRRVVNLYVTEDRELRENTSKAVLLQIIPFFA